MKKIVAILLTFFLFFGLTGCGNSPKQAESDSTAQTEQTESPKIEVEKELFDVKLNLPASMFEGQDMETVKKDALAEGVHEVIVNDDGSVTYIMSKKQHRAMLEEIDKSISESVTEFLAEEENKAIYKAIEFNKDYTEMTAKVDPAQYVAFANLNLLGLEFSAVMYQMFSGIKDAKVKVNIANHSTGEVVESYNFPLEE
ncbi:MAG TPA: hypothetical protein GXZ52_00470 [Clostridiales bacterium]|nr:hypothetical protein [Clostridiales bacterium]